MGVSAGAVGGLASAAVSMGDGAVGVNVGRSARCGLGVGVGYSTSELINAQPGVSNNTANAMSMASLGERNREDLLAQVAHETLAARTATTSCAVYHKGVSTTSWLGVTRLRY